MPLPTITGKNYLSQDITINSLPNAGQTVASESLPVVIASNQSAVPVSVATLPLASGAATANNQTNELAAIGTLTETPPTTDTASAGLNGRLQRVAQRLTSFMALFPTSIGLKASAGSLSVVLATDSAPVAVRMSSSVPLGYVKIGNLSSVQTLGTIPNGAKYALIAVGGASARYRDDGTNPTATVGMPIFDGDIFTYDGPLSAFKIIQTATAATLDVTFYG